MGCRGLRIQCFGFGSAATGYSWVYEQLVSISLCGYGMLIANISALIDGDGGVPQRVLGTVMGDTSPNHKW